MEVDRDGVCVVGGLMLGAGVATMVGMANELVSGGRKVNAEKEGDTLGAGVATMVGVANKLVSGGRGVDTKEKGDILGVGVGTKVGMFVSGGRRVDTVKNGDTLGNGVVIMVGMTTELVSGGRRVDTEKGDILCVGVGTKVGMLVSGGRRVDTVKNGDTLGNGVVIMVGMATELVSGGRRVDTEKGDAIGVGVGTKVGMLVSGGRRVDTVKNGDTLGNGVVIMVGMATELVSGGRRVDTEKGDAIGVGVGTKVGMLVSGGRRVDTVKNGDTLGNGVVIMVGMATELVSGGRRVDTEKGDILCVGVGTKVGMLVSGGRRVDTVKNGDTLGNGVVIMVGMATELVSGGRRVDTEKGDMLGVGVGTKVGMLVSGGRRVDTVKNGDTLGNGVVIMVGMATELVSGGRRVDTEKGDMLGVGVGTKVGMLVSGGRRVDTVKNGDTLGNGVVIMVGMATELVSGGRRVDTEKGDAIGVGVGTKVGMLVSGGRRVDTLKNGDTLGNGVVIMVGMATELVSGGRRVDTEKGDILCVGVGTKVGMLVSGGRRVDTVKNGDTLGNGVVIMVGMATELVSGGRRVDTEKGDILGVDTKIGTLVSDGERVDTGDKLGIGIVIMVGMATELVSGGRRVDTEKGDMLGVDTKIGTLVSDGGRVDTGDKLGNGVVIMVGMATELVSGGRRVDTEKGDMLGVGVNMRILVVSGGRRVDTVKKGDTLGSGVVIMVGMAIEVEKDGLGVGVVIMVGLEKPGVWIEGTVEGSIVRMTAELVSDRRTEEEKNISVVGMVVTLKVGVNGGGNEVSDGEGVRVGDG